MWPSKCTAPSDLLISRGHKAQANGQPVCLLDSASCCATVWLPWEGKMYLSINPHLCPGEVPAQSSVSLYCLSYVERMADSLWPWLFAFCTIKVNCTHFFLVFRWEDRERGWNLISLWAGHMIKGSGHPRTVTVTWWQWKGRGIRREGELSL